MGECINEIKKKLKNPFENAEALSLYSDFYGISFKACIQIIEKV